MRRSLAGGTDVNQRKRLRKRLLIRFNPDFFARIFQGE